MTTSYQLAVNGSWKCEQFENWVEHLTQCIMFKDSAPLYPVEALKNNEIRLPLIARFSLAYSFFGRLRQDQC